jgi:hypothetical protein
MLNIIGLLLDIKKECKSTTIKMSVEEENEFKILEIFYENLNAYYNDVNRNLNDVCSIVNHFENIGNIIKVKSDDFKKPKLIGI